MRNADKQRGTCGEHLSSVQWFEKQRQSSIFEIIYLASNQRVGSSNLSGRATFPNKLHFTEISAGSWAPGSPPDHLSPGLCAASLAVESKFSPMA
jgi:hypothetical protein